MPDAPPASVALLRSSRLFSVLDDAELQAMVEIGKPLRVNVNDCIFVKGDPGDSFYAIMSGQLAVHTESTEGKIMFLNILIQGDVVGEIAMLDGGPRTASVTCQQPGRLIKFERQDFMPILEARPSLAIRLMGVLCERLRWTSGIIEDTIFLNVTRRLAKRILLLGQLHGRNGPNGNRIGTFLSQEDLARMMGASREIINRTLRSFQASGAISYRNGYMIIRDPQYLERVAG